METNQEHSLFEMELDSTAQLQLHTISKWARLIAIAGFSITGLVTAFLIIKGSFLFGYFENLVIQNGDAKIWTSLILIAMWILLWIAWLVLLLRLSMQLRNGLLNKNTADLDDGLKSLRFVFVITAADASLSIIFFILSLFYSNI